MSADIEKKVAVKLFIGYEAKAKMRQELGSSQAWKLASLSPDVLKQVRYQDQDYIGRFLNEETTTLKELKEAARSVRKALQPCCPNCNLDHLTQVVFAQIFLH